MSDRVAIVGVGWFGYRPITPDVSYKEMMYRAAVRAYEDAGIDPRRDVDSFVTVAEDFHEGTSIFDEYVPDQLGAMLKPVHTIGGDGLHGIGVAVMLIRTGQCDVVVVEGHSKASNIVNLPRINAYAQDPVLNRPLRLNSHFIAGLEMNRYQFETGTTVEQIANVVTKNRANALANPLAPYGASLAVEDVLAGQALSWPLTTREVAEHADGSVVMVLASAERASSLAEKPVWVRGIGWCNGAAALESREWADLPHVRKAAAMAYRQAGMRSPFGTVDFAEIDDTYAYKELQHMEALGLCRAGEAGPMVEDGVTLPDGDVPVNVSGGSLGMGDLLEANGLARALEAVLQLRGEAGGRQLPDAEVALVQSWRGVPTTSTAVAVLSR